VNHYSRFTGYELRVTVTLLYEFVVNEKLDCFRAGSRRRSPELVSSVLFMVSSLLFTVLAERRVNGVECLAKRAAGGVDGRLPVVHVQCLLQPVGKGELPITLMVDCG
jgi:hypothetical protein